MNATVTAIKCYCKTNADLRGAWNASDVKENLEELDMPDCEWLEYLLGRFFSDYEEFTSEILNVVVNDSVKEITLTLDGHNVTIKKFYHTEF